MPDIIITPGSGIIDFYPASVRVGRIEGSGNTINIINPSGYIAASGSGLSINTSSPNAILHAFSSVSGTTLFNLEGTNGSLFSVVDSLSGSLMSVNNNAGLPVFEVFSDDRIVGGRFGQSDWIVTSGGNVGIGTGVPSSKFHVVGTSTFGGDISSTGSFIAGSGSVGNPSFEFVGDTDTGMFSSVSNTISFATSGVERVRIGNTGLVGIGTITPSGQLHVVGSGIFSSGLFINGLLTSNSGNFTNSLQINGSGVGLYDISVLNLGTVSGSNSINCGQDRQIQNLTLNGVATTFTKGSGWPTTDTVSRETTLNIFASGNTSVTWTVVNDWYRQPDSPLPSGRHIVLLRAIGSGTMQGHYIGSKTN